MHVSMAVRVLGVLGIALLSRCTVSALQLHGSEQQPSAVLPQVAGLSFACTCESVNQIP